MHPFMAAARGEANWLFKQHDERFEPRVFWLHLPTSDGDTEGVRADPSDFPFLAEDVAGIIAQAQAFRDQDPEHGIIFGADPVAGWTEAHERHEQGHRRQVWCRAVCRAVEEAVSRAEGNVGFVAFSSWPVERDGGEEVIILQLQQDVWESHPHLTKRTRRHATAIAQRTARSLVDALALLYLEGTAAELENEEPGRRLWNIPALGRVLTRAGSLMMRTPAVVASNGMVQDDLYDIFCTLATLRYEGKEGVGRILLSRPNHPSIDSTVRLNTPVSLTSPGAVRKLLQMGRGKLALLSDGSHVYGLGELKKGYDIASEEVFSVEFTRQGDWGLFHANRRMMHVHFGTPSLGPEGFPEVRFRNDLPRVIKGIHQDAVTPLAEIARVFAEQSHGCLLVVTRDAESEADRLATQCTRVLPFPLTGAVIPLVTAIDGAVLVDTNGLCHAIGVILDGPASPKGSSERGARYNSAVRYTEWKANTVALVKSEDGMVSFFPALRPQMSHSDIVARIEQLRRIASLDEVDRSEFVDTIRWLEDRAFYLKQSECDEVNRLYEVADKKTPPSSLHIHRDPLTPHHEMDDSYYLPG